MLQSIENVMSLHNNDTDLTDSYVELIFSLFSRTAYTAQIRMLDLIKAISIDSKYQNVKLKDWIIFMKLLCIHRHKDRHDCFREFLLQYFLRFQTSFPHIDKIRILYMMKDYNTEDKLKILNGVIVNLAKFNKDNDLITFEQVVIFSQMINKSCWYLQSYRENIEGLINNQRRDENTFTMFQKLIHTVQNKTYYHKGLLLSVVPKNVCQQVYGYGNGLTLEACLLHPEHANRTVNNFYILLSSELGNYDSIVQLRLKLWNNSTIFTGIFKMNTQSNKVELNNESNKEVFDVIFNTWNQKCFTTLQLCNVVVTDTSCSGSLDLESFHEVIESAVIGAYCFLGESERKIKFSTLHSPA